MAGYLGSVPVPQATQHRETFTATAAQTSFATAGYTPQFVDVYLNGVHLSPADVTATNGSDVVLTACLVNDIVDVVSYTPFEVASQTFTGTTTMDVSLTTGVLTANGGAVFNEEGANVDFRVEGPSNPHAFSLDASTKTIGINTAPVSGRTISIEGEGNLGAGLSLNEDTRGAYVEFRAGSGTELYVGSKKSILGSGGNNTFLIHTGVTALEIDRAGIVTMPKQPAFSVKPSAVQSNLPINANTPVKLVTEAFDLNADFTPSTGNGSGADSNNVKAIFTAPVAGKYQLNAIVYLTTVDIDNSYLQLNLATTLQNYYDIIIPASYDADAAYWTLAISVLANMDLGDTAFIQMQIPNDGAAQTDVATDTHFSGYLVA